MTRPERHGGPRRATTRDRGSSALGLGCLVLFALPFAAFGAMALVMAASRLREAEWQEGAMLGAAGLLFGGVGVGLIVGARIGRRVAAERERLEAAHPGEPWRWRPDWAAGKVVDASKNRLVSAAAFAAFWNLIAIPTGWVVVRAAVEEGNEAALIGLLFPVIGVGLIVRAVRAALHYRRFGVSELELATVPAAIGRSLEGTVRAAPAVPPAQRFQVVLSRIRRVTTGAGKNRSTREHVEWREETAVPGRRDARGVSVPVAFRIPAGEPPSDVDSTRDGMLWRLEVSADVPGVDYRATFEVPVFRTAESEQPLTADEERMLPAVPAPAAFRQPPESGIQVNETLRGTEIVFERARNPGAAAGLAGFLAIWLGAAWALIHWKAPLVFPIVLGLLGVLILWGVLELLLRSSSVVVDRSGATVTRRLLGPGTTRVIPAAEIDRIVTRIGMEAGGTPYYDVQIRLGRGKPVTAGTAIRDKREAEWIVSVMECALGRR